MNFHDSNPYGADISDPEIAREYGVFDSLKKGGLVHVDCVTIGKGGNCRSASGPGDTLATCVELRKCASCSRCFARCGCLQCE